MPDKFTYQDCEVVIDVRDNLPHLTINGKEKPVRQDADTNAYTSPAAPYVAVGTIEELAKAVVDHEAAQQDNAN